MLTRWQDSPRLAITSGFWANNNDDNKCLHDFATLVILYFLVKNIKAEAEIEKDISNYLIVSANNLVNVNWSPQRMLILRTLI